MMLFALGLTWCSSVVIGQFRSVGNVMICFCQLSRKDFLFGNVLLVKYSTYLKYQKNNSPASVYDFPLKRSAWVFDQLKREESTIEALCERNTALEAKKTNLFLSKGRSLSTFAINLFF